MVAGSLACALTLGCSDSAAPTGTPFIDGGVAPLCNDDTPCSEGFICVMGACAPDPSVDGGTDLDRRLQVCTPTTCSDPLTLNFDGARVGSVSEQSVTLRSVGARTVTIQNVSLLDGVAEFTVDPFGNVATPLAMGEDAILRVRHTAVDGTADRDRLQIRSDALRSVILIDVRTEYRGVPALFVGESVAQNDAEVEILDFGSVRAGVPERRTLFLKNRDLVIDGSVLEVAEVRTEPPVSINFQVTTDEDLPAFLNQYRALCSSDDNCDLGPDDACDTAVGACRTPAGSLRDAVTVELEFVGTTPGLVEESLQVVSTSGGEGFTTRTIVLKADVSPTPIDVDPDPIDFPETYLGFPDQREVIIRNQSTTAVVVEAVVLAQSSTFTLSLQGAVLPATLAPGDTLAAVVTYAPTLAATDETVLEVESNDPIEPTARVRVTGRALVPPVLVVEPGVINFGDAHVRVDGQPAARRSVTIRNGGGSELRVSSILPVGTSPAGTFVAVPTSLPPIPPGDAFATTIDIEYRPTAPTFPEFEEETFEIISNDPTQQPTRLLSVTGRATDPSSNVGPSTVNANQTSSNLNAPSSSSRRR